MRVLFLAGRWLPSPYVFPWEGRRGKEFFAIPTIALAPSIPTTKGKYWFSNNFTYNLTLNMSTHLHAPQSVSQAQHGWDHTELHLPGSHPHPSSSFLLPSLPPSLPCA